MSDPAVILLTLGALLLIGLLGDLVARYLPIPRVTLLILAGVLVGPPVLDLLPERATDWYDLVSRVALLMIGFLLGGKLDLQALRRIGKPVLVVSSFEVLGVALLVGLGLYLAGVPPVVALLLAGIAPASAPAAVTAVVQETEARGRFVDTLLGIVAIDDAWGLVVFAFCLAIAQTLAGSGGGGEAALLALRELGGAVVLGAALGVPAAYLTGRLRPGEPTQAEALGLVLVAGGLATWLHVSFLLTAMVTGAAIVNLARHHERPFNAIEAIEWPFMVIFFVLAGAKLKLAALVTAGPLLAAYIALRTLGLVSGAYVGGWLAGAEAARRRWLGPAILPQAGVALGMALIAAETFPEGGATVLPLVTASTVVFELAGPIATRIALARAGAIPEKTGGSDAPASG